MPPPCGPSRDRRASRCWAAPENRRALRYAGGRNSWLYCARSAKISRQPGRRSIPASSRREAAQECVEAGLELTLACRVGELFGQFVKSRVLGRREGGESVPPLL